MKSLELSVSADIPDDNEEVIHEAIVACKQPVLDLVKLLESFGLKAHRRMRTISRRPEKPEA